MKPRTGAMLAAFSALAMGVEMEGTRRVRFEPKKKKPDLEKAKKRKRQKASRKRNRR